MHLCIAGSVRAMPEKEKPPAMPVDIYSFCQAFAVIECIKGNEPKKTFDFFEKRY